MHRFVLGTVLAFAAAPALAQQTAGEVYKWTDANGVTHYSQTPPASGKFEHRLITSSGATAPTAVEDAAEAPANPQCTAARANLTALQAEGDVMQDSDGDGKPDQVLNAEQRANQLELAQAAAKAYCTP
ncbi:DUF4124 domain-containing protein [Luteimonas sp. Sa2BVA3]|uniref:DUF4124 domain-containing protein n=1 Tax=Luteimonas colneyensis TaxID=2762230 RepID=A0ABR8UKH3_9GAMM|nr:DUF4124 domain-containing protein [Luteimonas colneyensis]MBD7988535.1 DUF4124 domain-containing protein [Luteimonas colneyensis]